MKKRALYGILLAGLSLNLIIGAQIYLQSAETAGKDDAYSNIALFTRVLEMVRQDYVDGEKLTYADLIRGAMKGMLTTLDPHSEFMDPPKYDELRHDTEGAFGGVGIVVSAKDGYLTVVAPMEDTPGFNAGILSGDRITKIDGKSAEKITVNDAVKRLRGKAGTKVTLTIFRPAKNETKDFTLTRARISVDTVKDLNGKREFPLLASKVGYLKLTQFGEKTSDELDSALRKLDKAGMQSLVIDLRGNPGGLLDQAVKVCEKFLAKGRLVVTTEGRDRKRDQKYLAAGTNPRTKLPLVLLVNGGSASASEIVSGCLQDTQRAIVVGEQTFGKGSVQSILPLPDNSALRLTTAKYYTPGHKVIHEHGITPDIIVEMSDQDEVDLNMKRSVGGLDSVPEKDRARVEKVHDVQLDRALDLLKGISIFTDRQKTPEKEKVAATTTK
ncbi:MAG: S41 family peptidase [Verrucomicrobia bacterium]|nr:S41 family peptidase [Verrucomicrobiota bacterium]